MSNKDKTMKTCASLMVVLLAILLLSPTAAAQEKIRLIVDTDAMAEIDDQAAITYALFSGNHFEVEGITVNRGSDGPHRTDRDQDIDDHFNEAVTVARLCASSNVPVLKGPAGNYRSVKDHVHNPTFDGSDAVNFIIQRAHATSSRKLNIYADGNLTNVALSLLKDPTIANKLVVWWIGTWHPANFAENNMAGDLDAASALLANPQNVPFNIIPGNIPNMGTTWDEYSQRMRGRGPNISPTVRTRYGPYTRVGDYLVELFNRHVGAKQKENGRSILDVVGFAVLKNNVGQFTPSETGAPSLNYQSSTGSERHGAIPLTWSNNPGNPRRVTFWRNPNRDAVYNDFYNTVENYVLPRQQPVKIIFDSDMGGDTDDGGCAAMLHALQNRGEVEVIACIFCTGTGAEYNEFGAGFWDAINHYYNRGDIPIGANKIPNENREGGSKAIYGFKDVEGIANATGAAATVTFSPDISRLEALVTIVTTMDNPDVLALARHRLAEAESAGFDGVLRENTNWWNAFYDKRENGRVFKGLTDSKCSEDIKSIYRSYADGHGGGTHTDMQQYECSAMYVHPERDSQLWSSAPCYNEVFTSNRFVRNWADNQQIWKQLVWHWMPGGKDNAKNLFGMPGMAILHGYQPPVKPDKIVHTTLTLEFCLETMAQIIKPAWDEWDYGGNVEFLREECYPLMREMALFYSAYAKKGDDGYYHVIPSMDPEKWGWYAELARNKDVISSLCMFRWALNRAADAAEILNVDADLRAKWREVAHNMAPYPTWEGPDGPMYCAIAGVEPKHMPGDHFGEAAEYPTILADEINLDSPEEQKEMMLRTAMKLSTAGTTGQTLILLGVPAESRWDSFDAETLLNSRSGRMHLFPAIAPKTQIAFYNFQARGGFLVSAARNAEEVYFIEVQPRRDNICRIMNPWPGRQMVVREVGKSEPLAVTIDKSNGECLEFSAVTGRRYSIEAHEVKRILLP